MHNYTLNITHRNSHYVKVIIPHGTLLEEAKTIASEFQQRFTRVDEFDVTLSEHTAYSQQVII